jgi:3-hydroxybutyryl-CoA dehydratase
MIMLTETGPRGLYFEEFEQDKTMVTPARTITEADIVQFAGLTGDYNPMHVDADYAANTMMGARIAHGMLTVSYAMGQAYQLGLIQKTVLAFRGIEMKFSAPVYIGDTIRSELKVAETKPAKRLGGGIVTLEIRIKNQDDKVVQKGKLIILVMSKPDDGDAEET